MPLPAPKKPSLYGNLYALSIVHTLHYLFPLLSWPFLAQHLGLHTFGVLTVVFAIYQVSNIITDFGFNFSATYTISKNQHNYSVINRLLGNLFTVKILLALFTLLFALPYIHQKINRQDLDWFSFLIIGATIFIQSLQCIWFFHGIEKMKYITIANLASKLVYLLCIWFLLPLYVHLNAALSYFFLHHFVLCILYFYFIYATGYRIARPQWRQMLHEARHSLSFFLARISLAVYTSANTLLIGHFNGIQAASLYGAAEKMYGVGTGLANILSQSLYPHMAKTGNIRFLIKLVSCFFIPFVLMCLSVLAFAEEIMAFAFGERFKESADYLSLFAVLACVVFLSITLGYPGFAPIGKLKTVNYITSASALLHLLGLAALYFYQNITPTAIIGLTLVSESFTLVLLLFFLLLYYSTLRRQTRFRQPCLRFPATANPSPFWRRVIAPPRRRTK